MRARHKLLLAAGALALLHAMILLAGVASPYDPAQQNRTLPLVRPMRLHLFDGAGQFHLRPFVYAPRPLAGSFAEYAEDVAHPYPVRFFVRRAESRHLFGVDEPGRIFLLGTDGFGRDQFSRLLFGGRISLLAALLATAVALLLGSLLGGLAGFYGGAWDAVLMRVTELFLAVPWLFLLFTVRALLPLRVDPADSFLLLSGVIGVVGWARPARLVRGLALSARERNYVLAARGFGASDWYLFTRHVLPQANAVLLTQAALLVPQYVVAEVTLSFLGLGVGEPVSSWGTMLAGLQYHSLTSHWWLTLPAVILVPIFLAYHALADALQQHFQLAL